MRKYSEDLRARTAGAAFAASCDELWVRVGLGGGG